ncbi:MAG: aminotransferase class V-fold PLP-dependent enzyme [Bauldia sp.]|uniref:aminotransferase class V-fold PLP-dependent enzyme n=1 Tax=Bauldia sp. TaxID=2575872 RepID=UPI001D37FC7C|nr:aminotransferase class V-fold PLP-dependent enzyme [Bauldia sp.]MCB1496554.1 aminotransferase class V-fold PLP-dependent enzyme [Bauldia sp.]
MSPFSALEDLLDQPDIVDRVRAGIIGDDATLDGPFGPKPLVYADYVASGRALTLIEEVVSSRILPFYANTHSRASFVGEFCTSLREEARSRISRLLDVGQAHSTIFSGSGATSGLNRLVRLLDIEALVRNGGRATVLIGPYEHHSNILPWRETGADVVEIEEAPSGGPSLSDLEARLRASAGSDVIVGSFSAASNVTGKLTDTDEVTRLLRSYKALSVWDYACAAPYLPMTIGKGGVEKDAMVFSAHKFVGGPGASGVLIVRDDLVRRTTPTQPGGGTVSYLSPWDHRYSARLCDREEAGTPNVLGDIRAAMVLMVKEKLGIDWLLSRQAAMRQKAEHEWARIPEIEILGGTGFSDALPIFSFRVRDATGRLVHHQLFTRMLSDLCGIQARGGCSCAGAYAHRLLGIDRKASKRILSDIDLGIEASKPGWVRLNFSPLLTDQKADYIIESVAALAKQVSSFERLYEVDQKNARYTAKAAGKSPIVAESVDVMAPAV